MKKRVRKKLFKGEFKEMGFPVSFRLPEDMKEDDLNAFIDQFLTEAIEAQGLDFGGSGRDEWKGFVSLWARGSATEEHRKAVDNWLKDNSLVVEHEVGELRDAWYGPFECE